MGFFDHRRRARLLRRWRARLATLGVKCNPSLSLVEYLSTPAERLAWQGNGLPADTLCVENAIVLARFNRYPLVMDPAGQATAWLLRQHSQKRIQKTSFLDAGFLKKLESALRFGTSLLVQDVEHVDPLLNPVLNREARCDDEK